MGQNEFGRWFRDQLLGKEMTQADFARRSGKRPGQVSEWVLGKRIPDPESCDIIADVLLLPLDVVLEKAGHRPRMETIAELEEQELLKVYRELPATLRPVVVEFAQFQLEQARRRG